MDHLLVLKAGSVLLCVMLMTGCTARTGVYVSETGQIIDRTNNPIYPELSYSPVTMEQTDANGNPI